MGRLLDWQRKTNIVAWCLMALTVLLTIWAYRPALDAGFVFDDGPNIVDSPAVHWDELSFENLDLLLDASLLRSRPVANLSFAIDHRIWGLDPAGFHLTNLLIHLAVGAVLVWICLLYTRYTTAAPQTTAPPGRALSAALVCTGVFLLHPINTQAVTYVVQRMASLAALFSLVAFASYLVARYRVTSWSRGWYIVAIAAFLFGLGSKENALLVLPVIVLYEACFFRSQWRTRAETLFGGRWDRSWTVRAWIGTGAATLLLAWAAFATSSTLRLFGTFAGRDFSGLERMLTQTRVQLFHLSQLVWPAPARLSIDHDFAVSKGLLTPLTTLPALLICLLILVAVSVLAAKRARYGFPLAAYAVFHTAEAGPVNLELVFEHRMYLPSAMLALLGTVALVDAAPRKRAVAATALMVLLIPMALMTYARNQVWADPLTLQSDIAAKSPEKSRAQYNYALALREAGKPEEALAVVQRAIELAPRDDRPHGLLGDVLLDLGRPEEAIQAYRTPLNFKPDSMRPLLGIGRALVAAGRQPDAFQHYLITGTRLGQGGKPYQALPLLEEAAELQPDSAEARHALGSAYLMAQKDEQALEQFRAAVRLNPTKVESWFNLGMAAETLDLNEEAVRAYERFVAIAPADLQSAINQARTRIEALKTSVSP